MTTGGRRRRYQRNRQATRVSASEGFPRRRSKYSQESEKALPDWTPPAPTPNSEATGRSATAIGCLRGGGPQPASSDDSQGRLSTPARIESVLANSNGTRKNLGDASGSAHFPRWNLRERIADAERMPVDNRLWDDSIILTCDERQRTADKRRGNCYRRDTNVHEL